MSKRPIPIEVKLLAPIVRGHHAEIAEKASILRKLLNPDEYAIKGDITHETVSRVMQGQYGNIYVLMACRQFRDALNKDLMQVIEEEVTASRETVLLCKRVLRIVEPQLKSEEFTEDQLTELNRTTRSSRNDTHGNSL